MLVYVVEMNLCSGVLTNRYTVCGFHHSASRPLPSRGKLRNNPGPLYFEKKFRACYLPLDVMLKAVSQLSLPT